MLFRTLLKKKKKKLFRTLLFENKKKSNDNQITAH